MNVQYKKPEMNFVSLRNENKVAGTCWGYHGTPTQLFYDSEGQGFVSFQIAEGNCALNLINVFYYESKAAYDDGTGGTQIFKGDSHYTELYDMLQRTGGAQGNPYKGEGEFVFPNDPDNMS